MNKQILILVLVVVGIFVVWGVLGGMEAQKIGVTCDMGLGDIFCWNWHTNAIGQTGEFLKNIVN